MIKIENTSNLTGVKIMGDLNDLNQLVDAFYDITVDEDDEKNSSYYNISNRVLGLCYDVRHAFMGHREVNFEESGITENSLTFKSKIAPEFNVYYSCNCLYPEMMFIMLALNDLVLLRMNSIQKPKYGYKDPFNKMVIWDSSIATIRAFQAAFNECVKKTLSPNSYARWIGFMNKGYSDMTLINKFYIDKLNLKYISLSKEQRLKQLSSISKKLVEFKSNQDHYDILYSIQEGARELGCHESMVVLRGFEYPEDIEW